MYYTREWARRRGSRVLNYGYAPSLKENRDVDAGMGKEIGGTMENRTGMREMALSISF